MGIDVSGFVTLLGKKRKDVITANYVFIVEKTSNKCYFVLRLFKIL